MKKTPLLLFGTLVITGCILSCATPRRMAPAADSAAPAARELPPPPKTKGVSAVGRGLSAGLDVPAAVNIC